jgi:sterol desaturase/sphingolipid hydroxylase (fatty acid hydroxylase superfamily)
MNEILQYFNSLEHRPLDRLLFLAIPIFILWFIESGVPLVALAYKRNKGKHAIVNFSFTLFHLIIHALLAVFVVLACDWCTRHQFGIVHWLNFPVWAIVVFGIFSMDFFGGWLVHIVQHKVPLFWRMHIVHHADNNVDVTSGLRHHPLEALFRWIFFFAGIIITGLPIYAVMIAQTIMSMFTMFTHANIRLPEKLDKALSYLLVSPNMHKVHHHWKQPFTDSNYGTALSIWDRMFGTFKYLEPGQLRYGLDYYYKNEDDEDFGKLLRSPFNKFDDPLQETVTEKTTTVGTIPSTSVTDKPVNS